MTIRLSKNTFFHWQSGLWFLRICGYGLHFKNIVKHPPLFSERNGYRKGVTVWKWRFSLLTLRGAA